MLIRTPWVLVLILVLLAPARMSRAETSSWLDASYMDRLGLFETPSAGARNLALGGTGVAWSEDLQSLTINPAGLAAITRIETQLGFAHLDSRQKITYFGSSRELSPVSTGLEALGVAYPLPSYRGSLVLAAGIFRYQNSVAEALWAGINAYDGDEESYATLVDGSLFGWTIGAGLALGPTTDVGFSLEHLRGTLQVLSHFEYGTPGEDPIDREIYEDRLKFSGWRAHLGLQSRPWRGAGLGLKICTPTRLNVAGQTVYSSELSEDDFYVSEEEIVLPYQTTMGFSQVWRFLRLSAALEHIGWDQSTVNGQRLRDEQQRAVLDQGLARRVGLELSHPRVPLRLYFGAAFMDTALNLLESGEYDVDGYVIHKEVDVIEARRIMSGGLAFFLSDKILIETALSREHVKRGSRRENSGARDVIQEIEKTRLLMTFSYRF